MEHLKHEVQRRRVRCVRRVLRDPCSDAPAPVLARPGLPEPGRCWHEPMRRTDSAAAARLPLL